MIVIITTGPCGIGKSTTGGACDLEIRPRRLPRWRLHRMGNPFEIYDEVRIEHLYQTLRVLIAFHIEHGDYHNFVIPYVFESRNRWRACGRYLPTWMMRFTPPPGVRRASDRTTPP